MRTFVLTLTVLMAWRITTKLLRVRTGKTYYGPVSALTDCVVAATLCAWGIYLLTR